MTICRAASLAALTSVLWAASPAPTVPHLASADPKSLYANAGSTVDITLYGSGLTTAAQPGQTPPPVAVLGRRNDGPFVDATKYVRAATSGRLGLEFDSRDFDLQRPGTVDFAVVVRGVRSNVYSIPVIPYPSAPPTIESIGPDTFASNLPTQHQYLFRIAAKDVPDDTKVSINGETLAYFADADFSNGTIDVYVPEDVRARAGRYPVVLTSRSGASNVVLLRIRDPRLASANGRKPPVAGSPTPAPATALAHSPPVAASSPMPAIVAPAIAAPATIAAATTAPATPVPPTAASPAGAPATSMPFQLDPTVMPRYRSLAAILLPSLRREVDQIVLNEVAALRAGPTDPELVALGSLHTIRPYATPRQFQILEAYVLANALDRVTTASVGDESSQQAQAFAANLARANALLRSLMKKTTEVQDTVVRDLR